MEVIVDIKAERERSTANITIKFSTRKYELILIQTKYAFGAQ